MQTTEGSQKSTMAEHADKDTQLMLRFQAGDEKSFEQLVERNKQKVLNLVYRFLGARQDSEDIAQEVFIKVYRARKTYKPIAKFITWLYIICKTTCYKELRKRKLKTVSLSAARGQTEDPADHQITDEKAPSPLGSVLQDERSLAVKGAIDSLPDSQKMALILRKYEHLSYLEISEALECTEKAVKSLLYRAKQGLKERLKDFLKK
jgi:RNA polymerase sigma-70 factor (ECF subfamily)